jgi:hypothetical protein
LRGRGLRAAGGRRSRAANWLGLPQRSAVVLFVAYVVPATVLLMTVGQDLVFFYPDTFSSIFRVALVVLVPVFWWATVLDYRRNATILQRLYQWRSPVFRLLLVYPAMAFTQAALVAIAPLGWIAAGTWLLGTERADVAGRIVVAERFRPGSQGCDQEGAIELLGTIDGICLEVQGLALPAQAGQAVVATGRESPLGFVVLRLRPADPGS